MLIISNLHSGYGATPVLKSVNLNVEDGAIVAVLGRNGAGKTTLLKTIVGLVTATDGNIAIDNFNITNLPAYRRVHYGIGYVPQGREIFASLTVRENIISAQHRRKKADNSSIEWVLDLFPMLRTKLNDRGDRLSGGQQQQLAIARALASRPKVLLLDEPSDGIQPSILIEIAAKLKEINSLFGTTIVLVEQNLEIVQFLSKEVYIMVKGEIVDSLPKEKLSFDNPLLREHLGV